MSQITLEIDRASPLPLYRQLQDGLQTLIESRVLKPADQLPTEQELVSRYGLSRTTIRRAFSDLVNAGLVERSAAKGTFVREQLSSRSSVTRIGVVAPFPTFFVQESADGNWVRNCEFLNGILDETAVRSVQAEIIPFRADCMADGNVDGHILLCVDDQPGILDEAMRLQSPRVVVTRLGQVPENEMNVVSYDAAHAVRQAVHYLAETGHRRIAYIGMQPSSKYAAFRNALDELAMTFDPDIAVACSASGDSEVGYEATRQLLERGADFDAILCETDYKSFGALRALKEKGIRVPQDISLMGCDNLPEAERQDPPLTTYALRWREVGRQAVRNLTEQLTNPLHKGSVKIEKGELIVRSSTRSR